MRRDEGQPCAIEGCPRVVSSYSAFGWCPGHYMRYRRYGAPTASAGRPSGIPRRPLADRFWLKVDKRGPDECWPWIGHIKRSGYGAISLCGGGSKIEMAHRVAYELAYGPIPDGLVVDHKCRVKCCVNASHLHAVTPGENNQNAGPQRGSASGIRNVSWTDSGNKWEVRVMVRGQLYRGGRFADLADAERAAIALRNQLMTNNLMDRSA